MTNKIVGYMLAVPIVLVIFALVALTLSPDLLSTIDLAIYILVALVFGIGLLVGFVKLWRLPNVAKQWLPVSNRWLMFWFIAIATTQSLHEKIDFGGQIEMLIGILALVFCITIIYRLIFTELNLSETNNQAKQHLIEVSKIFAVGLTVAIAITGLVYLSGGSTVSKTPDINDTKLNSLGTPLTEEQLVDYLMDLIDIHYRLYQITLDDSPEATTDAGIIQSFLTETLNDRAKLQHLLDRIRTTTNHENKMVQTWSMVVHTGLVQLIDTHDQFAAYLRRTNTENVDISEFQYQFLLFQSETKDTFLTTSEASVKIMQMIFADFNVEAEDDIHPILIGEESRQKLIAEIDRLFAEAFIEQEQVEGYSAPVFVMKELRDVLEMLGPIKQ